MMYLKENRGRFCTVGWHKNPERDKFAKYSHYIYQNKTRIAIARADNDKIESGKIVDDVLSDQYLKLLLKDGYSYGSYLDKKMAQCNPNLNKTSVESMNMINMILARRADYFFYFRRRGRCLDSKSWIE